VANAPVTLTTQANITPGLSGNVVLGASLHFEVITSALFQLSVTAAAAAVTDTLNVYLQYNVDGTNWDDFVSFTQAKGNGGAQRFVGSWLQQYAPTSPMHPLADASLPPGVNQGPIMSDSVRVKWVVVGGTANFSFTVLGSFMRLTR